MISASSYFVLLLFLFFLFFNLTRIGNPRLLFYSKADNLGNTDFKSQEREI